jgi:hypothetical protein
MPGPPPKAAGARARRNKSSTAAVIKRDPKVRAPKLPPHPAAEDGRDWHVQTLAWWKDVWKSPMAPEFDESDRHGLFALAMLVDDFWSTGSARLRSQIGAEIRLQGVRFGLSPIDRRRLQWEIERTEEAVTRGSRRRGQGAPPAPAPAGPPVQDPREVLRLVQ